MVLELTICSGLPTNAVLTELADLHAACFNQPGDETWDMAAFEQVMQMPGAVVVLARGENSAEGRRAALVGFAVARRVVDEWALLSIGVGPQQRRSGTAERLLVMCFNAAREHGARHVFLEVRESNLAALGLYRKVGFEVVRRRPGYYLGINGVRVAGLTMRRSL